MNKVYFYYPCGKIRTGQQYASELLLKIVPTWADVQLLPSAIPVFERTGTVRPIYAIGYLFRIFCLWLSWAAKLVVPPATIYLNLGQSWISLLREGLWLGIILRLRRHTGIVSLHGHWFVMWSRQSLHNRLFLFILRPAAIITVLGECQKKCLLEQGICAQRIRIIPNTCELVAMTSAEILAKHEQDQVIRILLLSNLVPSKGYQEYLQALELLAEDETSRVKIEATLCGPLLHCGFSSHAQLPDQAQWINETIARINQSPRIKLVWVAGAYGRDKEQLFRQSHIFVFPSKIEAQPIVLVEALSCGCVPITSMAGEIPSSVPASAGILLSDLTPQAIKQAILALTERPVRYEMAQAGLAFFLTRYTIEHYIHQWVPILTREHALRCRQVKST